MRAASAAAKPDAFFFVVERQKRNRGMQQRQHKDTHQHWPFQLFGIENLTDFSVFSAQIFINEILIEVIAVNSD
jgi:hypothetical protein